MGNMRDFECFEVFGAARVPENDGKINRLSRLSNTRMKTGAFHRIGGAENEIAGVTGHKKSGAKISAASLCHFNLSN
ncbi:hypothetical protein [Chitinophaga caseinilytica]|uniref:Uncharacterized protein n=1 Tax=Chitinophaga caseinilytica TaxID=2267521 RepID=A0ABZ2Z0L6_9BACT